MKEKSMYFAKNEIYEKIREAGGIWNDSKIRPIVCLIESTECPGLYWAIPVGMYNHRDRQALDRIEAFLNCDENDLRSCYYHIGNTTTKSIFFISDVIPITKKYISRDYLGYDKKPFTIKNKKLLSQLNRKLNRILSFENSRNNYFRQHITSIKNLLIEELNSESA